MSEELSGSCLCGEVRFVVEGPFEALRFCYCSRCRKASGSAHASNLFARAGSVRWLSGEDRIVRYELAGLSPGASVRRAADWYPG